MSTGLDDSNKATIQLLAVIAGIVGCGVLSVVVFPYVLRAIRPSKYKSKRGAVAISSSFGTSSQQALKELLSGEDTDTVVPSKKARRKSELKKKPSSRELTTRSPEPVVEVAAVAKVTEKQEEESFDDLLLLSKLSSTSSGSNRQKPAKAHAASRKSVIPAADPAVSTSSESEDVVKAKIVKSLTAEAATSKPVVPAVEAVIVAEAPAHLDRIDSKASSSIGEEKNVGSLERAAPIKAAEKPVKAIERVPSPSRKQKVNGDAVQTSREMPSALLAVTAAAPAVTKTIESKPTVDDSKALADLRKKVQALEASLVEAQDLTKQLEARSAAAEDQRDRYAESNRTLAEYARRSTEQIDAANKASEAAISQGNRFEKDAKEAASLRVEVSRLSEELKKAKEATNGLDRKHEEVIRGLEKKHEEYIGALAARHTKDLEAAGLRLDAMAAAADVRAGNLVAVSEERIARVDAEWNKRFGDITDEVKASVGAIVKVEVARKRLEVELESALSIRAREAAISALQGRMIVERDLKIKELTAKIAASAYTKPTASAERSTSVSTATTSYVSAEVVAGQNDVIRSLAAVVEGLSSRPVVSAAAPSKTAGPVGAPSSDAKSLALEDLVREKSASLTQLTTVIDGYRHVIMALSVELEDAKLSAAATIKEPTDRASDKCSIMPTKVEALVRDTPVEVAKDPLNAPAVARVALAGGVAKPAVPLAVETIAREAPSSSSPSNSKDAAEKAEALAGMVAYVIGMANEVEALQVQLKALSNPATRLPVAPVAKAAPAIVAPALKASASPSSTVVMEQAETISGLESCVVRMANEVEALQSRLDVASTRSMTAAVPVVPAPVVKNTSPASVVKVAPAVVEQAEVVSGLSSCVVSMANEVEALQARLTAASSRAVTAAPVAKVAPTLVPVPSSTVAANQAEAIAGLVTHMAKMANEVEALQIRLNSSSSSLRAVPASPVPIGPAPVTTVNHSTIPPTATGPGVAMLALRAVRESASSIKPPSTTCSAAPVAKSSPMAAALVSQTIPAEMAELVALQSTTIAQLSAQIEGYASTPKASTTRLVPSSPLKPTYDLSDAGRHSEVVAAQIDAIRTLGVALEGSMIAAAAGQSADDGVLERAREVLKGGKVGLPSWVKPGVGAGAKAIGRLEEMVKGLGSFRGENWAV
ncbi:hypothetical protein HDU67_006434 [Dinochytrium kinnereticum]|nr:hypothetical protein HDU67_006434 [Dinochytrium kinnereticum]